MRALDAEDWLWLPPDGARPIAEMVAISGLIAWLEDGQPLGPWTRITSKMPDRATGVIVSRVDCRGMVLRSLVALTLVGCARTPIELREAIPASELPRLEREMGVRIVGYQSKHPGIDTVLTIGGGVEPDETLEAALERTRRTSLEWSAHRRPPPADTGARHRADLEVQISHLERHGLVIHLVYVDGPVDALRARTHALVAR